MPAARVLNSHAELITVISGRPAGRPFSWWVCFDAALSRPGCRRHDVKPRNLGSPGQFQHRPVPAEECGGAHLKRKIDELLIIGVAAAKRLRPRWRLRDRGFNPTRPARQNARRGSLPGLDSTASEHMLQFLPHGICRDPTSLPRCDHARQRRDRCVREQQPVEHDVGIEHEDERRARGWRHEIMRGEQLAGARRNCGLEAPCGSAYCRCPIIAIQ